MQKKTEKFYVTTPIYYPNSKPHLGTLYTTLLADIVARWNKLKNKNTFFLTGLDEHGQKMEEAANHAGKTFQEFADLMVPNFENVWKKFDLNYDKFIRTSSEEHKAGVKKLFEILLEKGDIYKSEYQGFYCTPCETFITQTDLLGDQLCPSCSTKVKTVSEESYFFKLSKYQDKLLNFYKNNPDFISPNSRMNEVISFVESGLKDLCVSRKSVKWGISMPKDPEHTIYVWGDALTNYISAIGFGSDQEKMQTFWPADLHIIGKDIVRFHAVFWPAFLMAADIELPKKLLVHGFILMGDSKMSKSKGNVISPLELASDYGVDQVRYYLARHIPVTQDGTFDFEELSNTINSDLANSLGNLLSRTLTLAKKNGIENLDSVLVKDQSCVQVENLWSEVFALFSNHMDKYEFHLALASLWKFIFKLNSFFQEKKPWVLAKNNADEFSQVIFVIAKSLCKIAHLLYPVMPEKALQILKSIGVNQIANLDSMNFSKFDFSSFDGSALFVRIENSKSEKDQVVDTKNKNSKDEKLKEEFLNFKDWLKVKIAVGQILSCDKVEKSEKLYKLEVDFGALGKRQVVSGIAKFRTSEQIVNLKCAFLINLEPRKIMGLESQAMILAAGSGSDKFSLTTFDNTDVQPGDILG